MNIFISYRRKTWPFTHRLAEKLRARLGAKVFVDTDSIDDDDFDTSILKHLRGSDIFVLVVSEYTFDPERIHRESDWVRREIREALSLDLPIVLAMIDGYAPPPLDQLPADIQQITTKQGIEFYPVYFDAGIEKLATFIREVLRQTGRPSQHLRRWAWVAGAAVLVGLVAWGITAGNFLPTNGGDATETMRPPTTELPIIAPTTSPTPSYQMIEHNKDWTPRSQEFNGVIMMLVPAGSFQMGNEQGQPNEKGGEREYIEQPFWLDRTEVTNAQFGSSGKFPGDNRPRDSVNWFQASQHCENRGARLPTEVEWEYAARGPDGLIYPWGNGFTTTKSINSANPDNQTADVGSKPDGVSWVGALDMSGNLWEWVSTIYQPYPYNPSDGRENAIDRFSERVLRGASWGNPVTDGRASFRFKDRPSNSSFYFGFRCARDWSPAD
ncbi:MAG: SUMF1/EgtB/PvdO family nonheme iron enzyme [Anaerolineae bacterium]|nr:SUMF1/EgtB/PvdO family nonheme iron enzyme [Anaerolineae bacterium]